MRTTPWALVGGSTPGRRIGIGLTLASLLFLALFLQVDFFPLFSNDGSGSAINPQSDELFVPGNKGRLKTPNDTEMGTIRGGDGEGLWSKNATFESNRTQVLEARMMDPGGKKNGSDSSPPPDTRTRCLPQEPDGEDAIPEPLLQQVDSWYRIPGMKPLERSTPRVYSSQIKRGDGPPRPLPPSSTIEKIGNTYYKLTDFCLTPQWYGGLNFYGQESENTSSIEICNEFGCWGLNVSNHASPPPSDAIWITSATAVIKCFTDSNPWHVLQHFLSLNQLLNNDSTILVNDTVHFHPTFVKVGIKTLGYTRKRMDPFREVYFRLWPLLPAILPAGTRLTQFNVLSDLSRYSSDLPRICYTLGYLDGPRVKLDKVSLVPSLSFLEVTEETVQRFLHNVLEMVGGVNLTSGWCPKNSIRTKPVMGFVLRKDRRVLCNVASLVFSALNFGFDVKLIRFENMSLEDQIRSVRMVDVLAGMHGAGLTNIVWARAGTVLLEIYPSNGPVRQFGVNKYPTSNYGALALASKSIHIATGTRDLNASLKWRDHDLVMDSVEFENMLNATWEALQPSCQAQ